MLALGAIWLCDGGTHAQPSEHIPWKDCLKLEKDERGGKCGAADSRQVWFRNQCAEAVDARICFERAAPSKEGQNWSCGVQSSIAHGELTNDGNWSCHVKDRLFVSARKAGSNEKLGRPE